MVKIEFDNDELSEIYEGNRIPKGYQPAIIKAFIKTVRVLQGLNRIEDLYKFNSLNFEALTNRKGCYSVRVNDQYRLEFKYSIDGTITIITITKLSNHYK
jgi:toxin HigB-1